ncbi:alpha/beta hydrolase [Paludibaculum fermentans]|uniref:Alpha/beta hydrolase n=1 Tax=Paludibaculum fermentans TaxID=1473598 RepID=A0A7S7SJ69_PALFE|nr:alpha/beta hydrolase [Paludibaculum fermentans]QOY85675.1 alpha/beta hydrolase [Paludibaculum fermentans]
MRIFTVFLTIASTMAYAAEPAAEKIWPKGAPGEKGDIGPEADTTKADGALVAGRRVIRLGNVSEPTITIYPAPKNRNSGAAVVVLPGGGYNILALDLEGTEVCEWLNSIGVTGILLKYRVPARKGGPRWAAPLQDAQRAVGIVRSRAVELQLDPRKIGVLGFSAGAHLAAVASTQYERRSYDAVDAADQVSSRPDFSVVIYPAYLAVKEQGDKLADETPVTANTPPTFLVQAEDDGVRVENSLVYYLALKNAKVPAEMHLFAKGGHGYGLRPTELPVTGWPKLAEVWMRGLGLIPAAK